MLPKRRKPPVGYVLSLILFFVSAISLLCSLKNPSFADAYSAKVGSFIRLIPLTVSNLTEVSLFEILLYTSPFWLLAIVFYAVSSFSDISLRKYKRQRLISLLLVVVSVYLSTLGISYFKSPKSVNPNEKSVYLAANLLSDRLWETEAKYINDADILFEQVNSAYSLFQADELDLLPIFPRIKIAKSEYLLTEMGILASYSFLSSEIIINPSAPDYTKPFSAAHEVAHLYGIAREDEASLYAFCALYSSDSTALRYSACLSALDYLLSELSLADSSKYNEIIAKLPEYARRDLDIGTSFAALSDGVLGEISADANDKLISVFDSDGRESYSRFSYLVADYLIDENMS